MKIIAINGTVGVGKTTLTNFLINHLSEKKIIFEEVLGYKTTIPTSFPSKSYNFYEPYDPIFYKETGVWFHKIDRETKSKYREQYIRGIEGYRSKTPNIFAAEICQNILQNKKTYKYHFIGDLRHLVEWKELLKLSKTHQIPIFLIKLNGGTKELLHIPPDLDVLDFPKKTEEDVESLLNLIIKKL